MVNSCTCLLLNYSDLASYLSHINIFPLAVTLSAQFNVSFYVPLLSSKEQGCITYYSCSYCYNKHSLSVIHVFHSCKC
jgi:hypothetical protein